MPQQLYDVAKLNGYDQIDGFYTQTADALNPCFTYGYYSDDNQKGKYNSAVFWCKKQDGKENEYYLLIASKPSQFDAMTIKDVIPWRKSNRVGGLSLYKDTTSTLDNFFYIDDETTGPSNVKLHDKVIRSEYSGLVIEFYKYKGRWLVRRFH